MIPARGPQTLYLTLKVSPPQAEIFFFDRLGYSRLLAAPSDLALLGYSRLGYWRHPPTLHYKPNYLQYK